MTGRGNIRRIREQSQKTSGIEPKAASLDREELAGRATWGNAITSCEGLIKQKPWDYQITAVIPTCGTPELTALCVALLRSQDIPIYCLLIDTGSSAGEFDRLSLLRAPGVEIHQIAGHGWRHNCESVGAAMALGQTICRSPQMLAIHSDVFLTSTTAVRAIQESLAGHVASGYQLGPHPRRPWADRFLSHSTTLARRADLLRHQVPWDFLTYQARFIDQTAGQYDPEYGLNLALPGPFRYLGQENREPQQDEHRIHLAAATSLMRMGGLDDARRGHLARAINTARELAAPVPGWAWNGLNKLTAGSPEKTGQQFAPVEWKPTESGNVVTFIAPFYLYDPILLDSLNRQTDPNWRLILIHDGKCPDELRRAIAPRRDGRVYLRETDDRFNDWGHTLRQIGLNMLSKEMIPADWVVITNGDNYYVPGFVASMLAAVKDRPMLAAYCDVSHNYWGWNSLRTCLAHGEIDCGCLMVRKDVAIDVGWRGREVAADWTYCADIINAVGAKAFAKVDRILFVHN